MADGGLAGLAKRLGLSVDLALLETAFTHASFNHENPAASPGGDNDRLEFLGDAVLQFASGQLLYRRLPRASAGELTRLRAAVVSEEALWKVAEGLGLGAHLRLGRGEEASGGRSRHSLLADAFEAVVGAIYVGSGIRPARLFVEKHLGPSFESAVGQPLLDPKTALQEASQAEGRVVSYRLVSIEGPDHDRVFEVEVLVDGAVVGSGRGGNKREAEREAASQALHGRKHPT